MANTRSSLRFLLELACGGCVTLAAVGGASATVLFQDGFESGNLLATQNGVHWGDSNGGTSVEMPVVSATVAHSGKYSLRFTYRGGASGEDSWSEQRFVLGRQMPEVYIQWYQWFPAGTDATGPRWLQRNDEGPDNNKFQRLWDDDYNNFRVKAGLCMHPYGNGNSLISPKYGVNAGGVGTFAAQEDYKGIDDSRRGRWVKFESHYKVDSGAGDGAIDLWIDGQKSIANSNLKIYPALGEGNYFANGYLMGWANSGFNQTSYTYIDDVTISDSFIP